MEARAAMLQGYLACALWSSHDNSREDGGDPLDKNYSETDIAPETLARAKADVDAFYSAHEDALIDPESPSFAHAGHDLWLTRNGHGAGFWDGDWPDEIGKRLTDAADAMGEVDLYVGDDGKIHDS